MRTAGRLAAETLDMIVPHVRPGVSTGTLDALCHEFIIAHGAIPAPLNYRGYPKSICTSINHVVCHGIPGERKLENGDILNIDVTVILNGWHGDSSRMYVAGTASTRARNLMDVTYEAMMRGVARGEAGRDAGRCRPRDPELMSSTSASAWCAISAATASGGASTSRRTCCISAVLAKARCCGRACSSPSSRW